MTKQWATYLLIIVNMVVFATYGFEAINTISLLDLGANFAPYTLGSEPFRLLTSMFLHGGVLHLIANMYSLYYVGAQVESKVGSAQLLIIYFITGLIAGLVSLNFNLFVVSVGASGAIFGIYAFLIVDVVIRYPKKKVPILVNFGLYLIVISFVGTKLHFDNAGHIGGVAAGIVMGVLYNLYGARLAYFSTLVFTVALFVFSPRNQVEYFEAYQVFAKTDSQINKVFNASLNDQEFYDSLTVIEELPEKAIGSFQSLEFIPSELTHDTTSIISYLNIRNQQIDYFKKGLSRESFIYLDSIRWLGSLISNLSPIRYPLNFTRIKEAPPSVPDTSKHLKVVRQNYDSNWFETNSPQYQFFRIGQQDSLGDWHGQVEDYFENGAIQMKGSYNRGFRDGIFIYYNKDSTYVSAGRYAHDDRVGKWEIYHHNGRLMSEIRHINGYAYLENAWDSTGALIINEGNGIEIHNYPNGVTRYRRSVKDGLNDGFIESYYPNGEVRFKEFYEKGKLVKGVSYADNSKNTYDGSVFIPYPQGGFEAFYDYVKKENEFLSDSISGQVVLRFDVHSSGRIHNIRFLRRLNHQYDTYAKKLLIDGPEWYPARFHGLDAVTSYTEVTINF